MLCMLSKHTMYTIPNERLIKALTLSKKGKVSPWSVSSLQTIDIGHTMSI